MKERKQKQLVFIFFCVAVTALINIFMVVKLLRSDNRHEKKKKQFQPGNEPTQSRIFTEVKLLTTNDRLGNRKLAN